MLKVNNKIINIKDKELLKILKFNSIDLCLNADELKILYNFAKRIQDNKINTTLENDEYYKSHKEIISPIVEITIKNMKFTYLNTIFSSIPDCESYIGSYSLGKPSIVTYKETDPNSKIIAKVKIDDEKLNMSFIEYEFELMY